MLCFHCLLCCCAFCAFHVVVLSVFAVLRAFCMFLYFGAFCSTYTTVLSKLLSCCAFCLFYVCVSVCCCFFSFVFSVCLFYVNHRQERTSFFCKRFFFFSWSLYFFLFASVPSCVFYTFDILVILLFVHYVVSVMFVSLQLRIS